MEKTRKDVGQKEADIFEVHSMMINDEDFIRLAESKIENGINAEAAITEAGKETAELFYSLNDEYMKQRAADVIDVAERITDELEGGKNENEISKEKTIIVSYDLTAEPNSGINGRNISGFVTEAVRKVRIRQYLQEQ